MKNLKIIITALLVLLIWSCSKDDSPNQETLKGKFIAGRITINGINTAVYWKDGLKINLVNQPTNNSEATDIFVTDFDVYVVGYLRNNSADVATIRKNGSSTALSNSTKNSYANSVVVSGNDIYVAGSDDSKAVWWKNGIKQPIDFSENNTDSVINAIAISGNDVYMAGYQINQTSGKKNATIWKNGSWIRTKADNTEFNDICCSGNDYYTVGNTPRINSAGRIAQIWKNGDLYLNPGNLDAAGLNSSATCIITKDGKIYVGGRGDDEIFPKIWEITTNGTSTAVSSLNLNDTSIPNTGSSNITSIAFSGNELFGAGYITASNPTAKMWSTTNGNVFSSVDGVSSFANALFIK
jgi:hypothetical protein